MRARATLLIALCFGGVAHAYDFAIDAETIGQGYQLRAGDDTLVNRRRLTQYLGLNVFNLGPTDLYGRPLDRNQFYVTLSMRFDAELADYAVFRELSGRTPQREVFKDRLDLLYAHVGGRSLFGFLDFKLGRQITFDLFDFQAFDGLSLEARTPFHVALEAWGGLAVTGAAPVDSPIYRTDGVALGGNPVGSLAARQEDALEPTFGLALKTVGLSDVTARLSYLRTMSFTNAPAPGEPDSGVLDEKLALTVRARLLRGLVIPWAGLRHNLLAGRIDEGQAGLRVSRGRHGVQAEYVFAAPTFDGDSIWNVFGAQAFNDVRMSYDLQLWKLRLVARGFARLFADETLSSSGVNPARISGLLAGQAYGGSAGVRIDLGRGYGRVDGYYEDGYGGTKAGIDVNGRLVALGDLASGLIVEGRLSYVYFRDDARPIDHAHSVGFQAGARYTFFHGITAHVVLEENVNRFWASQFRVLALLDLSFFLGPRGRGGSHPRAWGMW